MTIDTFLRAKLLPIALLCVGLAMPCFGQAAASIAAAAPAYDVVSIKPHHATGDPNHVSIHISISNEGFVGDNVTLKQMIQYAYELKTEDQIVGNGAPGWVNSAHFDVEAKIDAETEAALKKMTEKDSDAQQRLMMQAMLTDRFQLKVHPEKKDLPIYALVIAKSGFKLKESDANEEHAGSVNSSTTSAGQSVTAAGIPLVNLCESLSQRLHREVQDRTGLKGKYDITLKWAPDELAGTQDAGGEALPGLFTAVEEQLGLKLESAKGLVDTIVIDRVEQPTEN